MAKFTSVITVLTCLARFNAALSIPQVLEDVANIPSLLSRPLERRDTCPSVWEEVAKDLKSNMGGCNKNARTSIRYAFHDAGAYSSKTEPYEPASGGADGSLLLNDEEMLRASQNPMQEYTTFLRGVLDTYKDEGVGAADLIQFAGAVGITQCPGGPKVRAVVGRKDSDELPPPDLLPAPFGVGATHEIISALFADKGLSVVEVAALMGAHTVSKAFASQGAGVPDGAPQDSTPLKWDNKYYKQVQSPPEGVFPFDSDVALSNPNTTIGEAMEVFASDMGAWTSAFVPAMEKLSLLGIPSETAAGFVDCSEFI